MSPAPHHLLMILLLCVGSLASTAASVEQAAESIMPAVAPRSLLQQSSAPGSSASNPRRYTLDVTVGDRAPDCVSRKVILVNGEFQPSLTLTQGDWVEITVKNNIAEDWPNLFEGISIHYHGFSLKGFAWMDGTKYVSQCPIARGTSFTYKFQVNEAPGTYFWHDHSNLNRADGLQGALIVKERPGTPKLFEADADETLLLSDWWHFNGNAMALRLNRPFDPTQATSATGSWCWIGLPKSVLINGVGNYYDCEDPYRREVNKTLPYRSADKPVVAAAKDLLNPPCVAGQLGPTAEPTTCDVTVGNSKCSKQQRAQITVKPGSTTRVRLINAASLVYMTVCFEKHSVTVIALDGSPIEPKTFPDGCADVNTGQRVDLLIKADQPSDRPYWISVASQYRKGAPSAYGVLRYSTASDKAASPDPANIVQPGPAVDKKWSTDVFNSFRTNKAVLAADSTATTASAKAAAAYVAPAASGIDAAKLPKKEVDKRYILDSTQPIIKQNGILRWALGNVAHAQAPPCSPVLDSVHADPRWAAANAVKSGVDAVNPASYWGKMGSSSAEGLMSSKDAKLEVVDAASSNADVFIKLNTPTAGTHVLTVQPGEIVEIVIQNDRAGYLGGEYTTSDPLTSKRNGREQHSFHLHGYHAWQARRGVGMGMGAWSPEKVSTYNLEDPPLRDTTTVLFNGTTEDQAAWVAFRFLAGNPGVWPLHCHILQHQFMGQQINIISDPAGIAQAKRPAGMPTCPASCMLTMGNTNPVATEKLVKRMAAPAASNVLN